MIKPRYKRFLEELPKNGNKVIPSAVKAGYSEKYAKSNGRTLMKNAVKRGAQEIAEAIGTKELSMKEARQYMYEIMGFDKTELLKNLKDIAVQSKDYGTRLKVIAPLVKEIGIDLKPEEDAQKVTVPVLNVVVNKRENEEQSDL